MADQVAVLLRFIGVDGLDFVLMVGFGEVVFEIPKVLRRAFGVFL